MTPPKSPEKINITSADEFRKKTGLTESTSPEWKEWQIVIATQDALDSLKASMKWKEDAGKRELAEAFIMANEKKEAEQDLAAQIGDEISGGIKDKLIKSGIVVGAIGAGTALAHTASAKIQESTGMKFDVFGKIQSWAREELKTAENGIWKWILGLIVWKSESDASPEIPAISEGEKKESARWAQKVFEKLTKDGTAKNSNLQVYFTDQKILSRSLSELWKAYTEWKSDISGFAEKLGFQKAQGNDIYDTVWLLLSRETGGYMKSLSMKNSQNIPVWRLFSSVAKYADMMDRIRAKWRDIDIRDMSFWDGSFLENMKEFAWDKKDMLNELKSRFAGFTPQVLSRVHTGYSTKSINEGVNFETSMGEFSEAEQKFLRETLPAYAKTLPDMIRSFSFSSPWAEKFIEKHIKDKNIHYADLIDIFVLSGGNTSLESMNAFEKSQVLMRIFLMIKKGNSSDGYAYLAALSGAVLASDTSVKIPSDVRILLWDLSEVFIDAISKMANEGKDMALGIAKVNPWFASWVWATLIWALWLAIKVTPAGRIASTFIWIMGAIGLGGTALVWYKISESGKIIDEKSDKEVADVEKIADTVRKQI